MRLWDIETWQATALRGHEDEVRCLTFSADGRRLITGDKEGAVRLWPLPPTSWPSVLRIVPPQPVSWFRLSPDSRRLLTFKPHGDYVVWDMDTGEKLATLTALGSCPALPEFSPDGRQLLVGGPTGAVQVWDFERNTLSEFKTGHPELTHPMLSMPGTSLFLMVHLADNTTEPNLWSRWNLAGTKFHFTLWDFPQQRLVSEFAAPAKTYHDLRLSSRGDLAIVHSDGSLSFQRIMLVHSSTNFWPHLRPVNCVSFTLDGSVFATAGEDGFVKLWDSATLREIARFKGHLLSSVFALDISPDGRRLATAGAGKRAVKLWDLETHQELITLSGEDSGVRQLEYSRDGNKLVGKSGEGLCIWRAPTWEEIASAEAQE